MQGSVLLCSNAQYSMYLCMHMAREHYAVHCGKVSLSVWALEM